MRLVPLVSLGVHFDSPLRRPRLDVVLLGVFEVLGLLKVLRHDPVVPLRLLGLVAHAVVDHLRCLCPLPRLDGGLDCLLVLPGFDEVVDGRIQLLLPDQPHAPLVLQLHHLAGEEAARKVDCPPERVAFAVRLEGALGVPKLLEEVARLLVQVRPGEGGGDRLEELWRLPLLRLRQRRRPRWEPSLEVELDRRIDVPLLLLHLRSLLLLRGHEQPLQVRSLELLGLRAVLALRDRNRLVPPVQLLVHFHGLLHLALLQQHLGRAIEVLVEGRHLGLHQEVLRPVRHPLPLRLGDGLVDFPEVHGARRVTKRRAAPLRNYQLELLHGDGAERLPHRLRLRRKLELFQEHHRALVLLVLDGHPELDERLVEPVRHRVDALVDNHLGAAARALDVLDVALDLEDGHALGRVDRVPDAEVVAVLRHYHVAVRHPLDVGAEVEERRARLRDNVEQVERSAPVAEE
mmetsp:Transcript_44375/g.105772  ORF Transcript_44375/g.105772 Transcript_44375/m.105772 type:complete len:460 (-) Transcript_44375:1730-3109(-)